MLFKASFLGPSSRDKFGDLIRKSYSDDFVISMLGIMGFMNLISLGFTILSSEPVSAWA